jgi:hypothetical protein
MRRAVIAAGIALFTTLFFANLLMAQKVVLGNYSMDKMQWGMRYIRFPIKNQMADPVRVNVMIQTMYPSHYASGLERLQVDTTLTLPPHDSGEYHVFFEVPGSYGRMATRATVYFWPDSSKSGSKGTDSTFQVFSTVFIAQGEAQQYGSRKHCVGPPYAIIDYPILNFELPRYILFMLARGIQPTAISNTFGIDASYVQLLMSRMLDQGFFPFKGDPNMPGILAISEDEAYKLKDKTRAAGDLFAKWFDEKGGAALARILEKGNVDDFSRNMPALRMALLLNLLEEAWADPAKGFDIARFENEKNDLTVQNRLHWIVQGGDFFLPRLCLAAFDQKERLHFGTFSPNPQLPFDKAPIYNLRDSSEQMADAIPYVDAAAVRQMLAEARKQGLIKELAPKLKEIIVSAQADLEKFQPLQAPYLADYFYQTALGAYFIKHKPAGLDCIGVKYTP